MVKDEGDAELEAIYNGVMKLKEASGVHFIPIVMRLLRRHGYEDVVISYKERVYFKSEDAT